MASSSLLTADVQPYSSIEGQATIFHREVESEKKSSSPQISPKQPSFEQLLEPWFGITLSSTQHRRPSYSNKESQPIPRSLMPSNAIFVAGFNLQSITDTTPGVLPLPAANSQLASVESCDHLLVTPNTSDIYHGSTNSPLYNPNAIAMHHGLFYDSPVYDSNPSRTHNGLNQRNSPIYNPIPRYKYIRYPDSPVYNPISRPLFNEISSNNDGYLQFHNEPSSSNYHHQGYLDSPDLPNQPHLNAHNRDDQDTFEGYTEWELILGSCDPNARPMLLLSDLSQGLKRSRSLDPYFSLLELHHPNCNLELGPGPSKKSKRA